MIRAGETEQAVAEAIKRNNRPYNLSTAEREELRNQGASDAIVRLILDPTLPYELPAIAPVDDLRYPDDEFASRVPTAPGAYLLKRPEIIPINLKTLLPGDRRHSLLLWRKTTVGRLVGPVAEVRVENQPAVFYLRLEPPLKIEDLVLVFLDPKIGDNVRELVLNDGGDDEPTLKAETSRALVEQPVEVGPGLFRITIGGIDAGEYFFYILGSADSGSGIYGKGYDFSMN
jgi:hypothetical protein